MPTKTPDTSQIEPELSELAAEYGVAIEYRDQAGVRRDVTRSSVQAVLASMGVDASTTTACRRSLKKLRSAHWAAVTPPSLVFRQGKDKTGWETWVHAEPAAAVRIWIDLEEGGKRFDIAQTNRPIVAGTSNGKEINELTYRVPGDLPTGWHRFVVEVDGKMSDCALVIAPKRLELDSLETGRQSWGVASQLYSARSHRSWGIGDLADLADMASWFGREHGADFMLVNPLHACAPSPGMEPSPYLPVTRRYVNPLYLRIEQIPEYSYLSSEQVATFAASSQRLRDELNSRDRLDRDASWAAKRTALMAIHGVGLEPGRAAQYADFRADEGGGLIEFATWSAISELNGPQWDEWPTDLQDPTSDAVTQFRVDHADLIEFHAWLQWVIDDQMASAQQAALDGGMSIGVMHDLAVGVHLFGSDTWVDRQVMAQGVTVGAPPDSFNQIGQDWSQPPPRPDQLAATGYASYRDMLRTLLRHSGGLRIDHVLGLFRLWWIPEGQPPSAGTYVRYDHRAMVDILVLEASRAGAVIVGEDLGTVEPWVQTFLADRGILGTSILWFERDSAGPIPPRRWRSNAMAAVTVHDLPPTLGYLVGSHVDLREELGLLSRPVEQESREHADEVTQWRDALNAQGLLRPGAGEDEVVAALHRYVSWTPAKLFAVSLADLVGERRTQTQPGTSDEYPNWRIPLADSEGHNVFIEEYPNMRQMARIISAIGASR
jgi:4-alpha-glucanotransferase